MKASIFLFTKASARLFEAPRSEFHLHSSHIFTIRPCQCYTIYNIHQSNVIQAAAICSKCRALRDVLLQITAITALRILSIAIRPNLAGIMSSLLSTLSYQHLVSRAKKTFACNAILNSSILNSFLSSGSYTFCFLMEHLKKPSHGNLLNDTNASLFLIHNSSNGQLAANFKSFGIINLKPTLCYVFYPSSAN